MISYRRTGCLPVASRLRLPPHAALTTLACGPDPNRRHDHYLIVPALRGWPTWSDTLRSGSNLRPDLAHRPLVALALGDRHRAGSLHRLHDGPAVYAE